MIYSRANAKDHDHWADLGLPGWSYKDVLPYYYKKSEHNERGANEFHGAGGPLNIADLRCVNPLSHLFVEAATKLGLALNEDFNGASQEGVGYFQVTQKEGQRHSAATAFFEARAATPESDGQDAHATSSNCSSSVTARSASSSSSRARPSRRALSAKSCSAAASSTRRRYSCFRG